MRNEAGGKSLLAAAESAEGAIVDDIVYHMAVTRRDVDGFGHNTGTPTAPSYVFVPALPRDAATGFREPHAAACARAASAGVSA